MSLFKKKKKVEEDLSPAQAAVDAAKTESAMQAEQPKTEQQPVEEVPEWIQNYRAAYGYNTPATEQCILLMVIINKLDKITELLTVGLEVIDDEPSTPKIKK